MTLAYLLRKLIGKHVVNESKPAEEKVAFDEIGEWAEKKQKEINDKENKILVSIKDKIALLKKELDEKVKVLEGIDVESKKVEDRIKLIVRANLNNYIDHAKSLIEDIDKLSGDTLDDFITSINTVFLEFDKKSDANYQKATFLIGNEVAAIKKSIIDFSNYITNILDENKDTITASKIISFVQLKINQINETDDTIERINEKLTLLNGKIKAVEEREKQVLNEIEKIKESSSYIKNIQNQENIKSEEENLGEELYKLKQLIDFKALGNIFHANEEKMGIVKAHAEKFETAFQKDDGASILKLLDEAKLSNEEIRSKIKHIRDKNKDIIENKSRINKNETEDLLVETNELRSEISKIQTEREKESKISGKAKSNREKIITSIKEELAKSEILKTVVFN